MAKPRIADAAGWDLAIGMDNDLLKFVEIHSPTGLTVDDSVTMREKRFSYVPASLVERSWYKVIVPGRRDKYFYGETAWSDAQRYARDEDWQLERAANGWS